MGARTASPMSRGTSIGTKIGALVGGLLVVLVASNGLLLRELAVTASTYDRLLAREVAQAEASRQIQVEFKKQVQEWKNILLRGSDPEDLVTYRSNFEADAERVRRLADGLVATVQDPDARRLLSTFREQHDELGAAYGKALDAFVASSGRDVTSADAFVRGIDRLPTDLLDQAVERLQAVVADRVAAQRAAVQHQRELVLGLGLPAVAGLLAVLVLVVLRIVRPIRALTRAAREVARDRMPAAVARIATMEAGGQPPLLAPFAVGTRDELAELASALTTMQDAAIDLAVGQHRRERESAAMLLNLGRRNQTLLARVLSYITDLEQVEQDPDVMAALFRIDHATTRVRRYAASMLVLSGAPPAPGRSRAVPVADVVRAALSEIEDYPRVDLYHLEEAAVLGGAATDLAHLLAEVLENATVFSPPDTRVCVVGQQVRDGYRIRVIDQGIGMTREELDAANQRIRRAPAGTSDARLLGLHVVGRLAARNDIAVRLDASAGHGITVSVVVPTTAVLAERTTAAHGGGGLAGPETGGWGPAVGVGEAPVRVEPVQLPAHLAIPAQPTVPAESSARTAAPVQLPEQVPVRVRGAGLARIGFADDTSGRAFAEPTVASSERLRAFQVDVDAARRRLSGPDLRAAGPAVDGPAAPGRCELYREPFLDLYRDR